MFSTLLLLFLVLPLVELALLLYLADRTSWWLALTLVLVTGIAGSWLAKAQGWRVWQRIRSDLAAGQLPGDALLDAALIFVAGALLITPGVLTDVAAIFLLLPPTRRWTRRRLVAWLRARFQVHALVGGRAFPGAGRSEVIDAQVLDNRDTPDASQTGS